MRVADTNVVSELLRPEPDQHVVDWFWEHEGDVYLTAVTVKELYFGVLRLPEGKRRRRLAQAIDAVVKDCAGKILPFDAYSGYLCARLHERAVLLGRGSSIEDLMIAAICQRNGAVLATRNVKDFEFLDLDVENPFEAG